MKIIVFLALIVAAFAVSPSVVNIILKILIFDDSFSFLLANLVKPKSKSKFPKFLYT